VKFAQVVGVFQGSKFDDAECVDQSEAYAELLGLEECAENVFPCRQSLKAEERFRNILDMAAKNADHSVLRLLQSSQQHLTWTLGTKYLS